MTVNIMTPEVPRPIVVESTSGHYLNLVTGEKVLDGCGGAAVSCIGHGNSEVIAAMTKQLQTAAYVHTLAYTTPPAEELADLLVDGKPGGLCKAFFVSSGSEAMDGAMKMARQYFYDKGELQRSHFISRKQGYHGNTIGTMSVSNYIARLKPYQDILMQNVSHVSPCYPFQYQGSLRDEEYVAKLAQELEDEFQRVGPDKVIAFMAETVGGATSGCLVPVPGYIKAMKDVCRRHGALFILDEVMCGMGRCGTLFAWQAEGDACDVSPDIMITGKGLGGGYSPIAAILANEDVSTTLSSGTGAFVHGQTYQAHPVSCAAALAVQSIVRRERLVERSARQGELLKAMLISKLGNRTHIGDIRGRGLFLAVEFVLNRRNKAPFPSSMSFGVKVQNRALHLGLAIYPGKGTIDGTSGDHVLIAPPFTVTDEELASITQILCQAYEDVCGSIGNE
ncbi:aminotransferase class-III [Xylariales sp. PMI_506]|nr:aminotransferase class-III [Xylariales sp. PMI_506]